MIPKFRAWLVNAQRMIDVEEIDFYHKTISYIEDDYVNVEQRWEDEDLDNVVLMQSTGLKDKYGVEIFEGDIINISSHTPFSNVVEFDKEGASFMLRPVYKRWSNSYFTDYANVDKERFEVIGNIYENAELLEV